MQLGNSPVLSVRIIRGLRSADNNVSVILRANLDVGQGSLVGCSGQLSLTSSSISTQRFKSLLCLAVQIVVIVVDNLLLRLSAGAVQSLLQSISSSAVARPSISGCRPVLSLYPTHRFCQYLLLIFITFTNSVLFNRAFSTNSRRPLSHASLDKAPKGSPFGGAGGRKPD